MDGLKENTKRDGKRRGFEKAEWAKSLDHGEPEPVIRFTAYAFEGARHFETLIEDEWGLESNSVVQLNRLCRWTLMEKIDERARETQELLEKGELSEHDALVVVIRESGGSSKIHNAFRNSSTCPNLILRAPAQPTANEATEPMVEYKVVQNRKGRGVVPVGSRGANVKKLNKESEKREAKVHRGPVHIYQVYLPSELPKHPQKPYRGCCEICDPSLVKIHRGAKNNDLMSAQF